MPLSVNVFWSTTQNLCTDFEFLDFFKGMPSFDQHNHLMTSPFLPLKDIHIVDLSTVFSGPLAAAVLADQGAQVIKVESLEGDTSRMIGPAKGDLSATFIAANRGKRAMAMDLKQSAAQKILLELIGKADVLINNFRPGVMERLGLSDPILRQTNPRLIRLSITGFGAQGEAAQEKVYDAVIQAVAGVAATQRNPINGQPTMLATAWCDKLTALNASQAVVAALYAREKDGQGRRIDVSMLDATLAFQWPDAMYNHVFMDNAPPVFPEFGVNQKHWPTRDGAVATMSPQQAEFKGQCMALDRADIADDPRFATLPLRNHNGKVLRQLLEPLMASFTTDELLERFHRFNVPVGRINERHEVLQDPHVLHSQSLVEMDHGDVGRVRLAQHAALFDGQRLPLHQAAAHLGEHSQEILMELGYSRAQIQDLADRQIIKV
jgi:crotonobetainyl-CoA:carnitine CoA-transferase CaiB-like acyl-CoA transferase